MKNFELFSKTNRHDNSMTESEKKQFRRSKTWLDHRQKIYDNQDGKDYITGKVLEKDWNCHHVVMKNTEYTNLGNPFYALNKETHKRVHETFSKYFDDEKGWKEFKKRYGNGEAMTRFYEVIEKMFELNDDIESVLYQNNYEYTEINPGDKYGNKLLAEAFGYPVNEKGYLQWNSRYIPEYVPQDTFDWVEYMMGFNKEENRLKILELRHMNLYSSYKNFRNNPTASINSKRACRKELENITKILRDLK